MGQASEAWGSGSGEHLFARKYFLHGVLGTGGMGVVYDAVNVLLGRRVAIKVLHPGRARSPVLIERFHREACAAASARHPNVIEVLDIGVESGTPYIVMEHLEGETLYDRLSDGPLEWPAAVAVADQVLDALDTIHRNGLVHRDIKPENVFLARNAQGEIAKIIDFGVVKRSQPDALELRMMKQGLAIGTPAYMSPEQAAAGVVDWRTDVYAVGVLLYEMVSGTLPFDGESEPTIAAVVAGRLRPLREVAPELPAGVVRIVSKAMAYHPAHRYQSAGELRRALAR